MVLSNVGAGVTAILLSLCLCHTQRHGTKMMVKQLASTLLPESDILQSEYPLTSKFEY